MWPRRRISTTFLAMLPADRTLWVADPSGEDPAEAARQTPSGPLVLVVGPEGGLAPEEEGILERAGARFVRLGGHRLRAETAAQTLLAAALTVLGEFAQTPKSGLTPGASFGYSVSRCWSALGGSPNHWLSRHLSA